MELQTTLSQLLSELTPVNIILAVLLIVNTIISEHPSIKASSIYGVLKTLLFTFIDQVKPQPKEEAPTVETPKAE